MYKPFAQNISRNIFKNQEGQTILQVMIAIGLLGILSLAFMEMMRTQNKSIKYIEQKQEALELKNVLLQFFGKSETCTWQIKNNNLDLTGVTTTVSNPNAQMTLTSLYMGSSSASKIIATSNALLPGTGTNLKVSNISLSNVFATGNANEYQGELAVNFDPSTTVMAFKPVVMQQFFKVNPASPLNAKTIACCSGDPTCPPDTLTLNISSNVDNYNIATAAAAQYGGSLPAGVAIEVIIANGVQVGSASTANPAMDSGVLPAGATLKIKNNGLIIGKGGTGGTPANPASTGSGCAPVGLTPGTGGGAALRLSVATTIENLGTIGGGGGGGGAGGSSNGGSGPRSGGAGGGGAGFGIRGSAAGGAANGLAATGGVGGALAGCCSSGIGGAGGNLGQNGVNGVSNGCGASIGGVAGAAILRNGQVITWTSVGATLGAIVP